MNGKFLLSISLLVLSISVQAAGVSTNCELISSSPTNSYFCDSFGNGASLVSQTWQVTFGGHITGQGTGFMGANCASTSGSLQYNFIAALSDGSTVTGSGSLPCNQSGCGTLGCGAPF